MLDTWVARTNGITFLGLPASTDGEVMPLKWVPPETFVDHGGVRVFRTYKYDNLDSPRTFWFTTSATDEQAHEFDIRDLPGYSSRPPNALSQRQHFTNIIEIAIERGHIITPGDD